jgi:hypothetical protein
MSHLFEQSQVIERIRSEWSDQQTMYQAKSPIFRTPTAREAGTYVKNTGRYTRPASRAQEGPLHGDRNDVEIFPAFGGPRSPRLPTPMGRLVQSHK